MDTPVTATSIALLERSLGDLRTRHAHAISHALFDEIRHLLPSDTMNEVSRALFEAVHRNGTMIITDKEAERLGLEPKDTQGWRASDRVEEKRRYNEALQILINSPPKTTGWPITSFDFSGV